MGHLVRAGVEFGVGQAATTEDRRHRVGLGCGPLDEETVERGLGGKVVGLVVPVHQDLLTLGRGQEGQGGQGRVRLGDQRGEQGLDVPGHAGHRGFVEEVGVVAQGAVDCVLGGWPARRGRGVRRVGRDTVEVEAEHQVELGAGGWQLATGMKSHGEQGVHRGQSQALQDLVESHLGPFASGSQGILQPGQQLGKRRFSRQIEAQGQHGAVGRRAHHHVDLPAGAVKEGGETRQEHGGQRHRSNLSGRHQSAGELRRQGQGLLSGPVALV